MSNKKKSNNNKSKKVEDNDDDWESILNAEIQSNQKQLPIPQEQTIVNNVRFQ